MQWTTRVNEAYRTLKSPVQRAKYLLEMHGVDVGFETNTQMPTDFLLRQLELRETLAGAKQPAALDELLAEVRREQRLLEQGIAQLIDGSEGLRRGSGRGAQAHVPRQARRRDRPGLREGRIVASAADLRAGPVQPRPTSTASRSASTSAPPIRWSPRCAAAWRPSCRTSRGARCCPRSCATCRTAASRSATRRRRGRRRTRRTASPR